MDAPFISDYSSDEPQRQALECLYFHLKNEAKYDQDTLKRALETSEVAFQCLVPFEELKKIVDLLEKRKHEDDQIRLCLISRVLKWPQIEESVNKYKDHFSKGIVLTSPDVTFFLFASRFFKHFKGMREELVHLDMIAKATFAVGKVKEEEVTALSTQLKRALKQKNSPRKISAPPPVKPPAPKAPPKEEEVLEKAQNLLNNLFKFKPPEKQEEVLNTLVDAFEIIVKDKNHTEVPIDKITKNLQEDKIADLLFRIVNAYLPDLLKKQILFHSVLKDFLKELGIVLFFQQPRSIEKSDKAKLELILSKANEFLQLVEKRVEYMNKHDLTADSLDEQLLNLVQQIIRKVKSRKLFNPIESKLEKLGVWIISFLLTQVLFVIFSPVTFLNIVDRLLDQPIDLNSLDAYEPSLGYFSTNDPLFEKSIGYKIKEIVIRVTNMGLTKSSPMLNWGISYLTPELLGQKTGQIFNRTLSSECSMKPVLLAYHILLKDGKPIYPTETLPKNTISDRMVRDIYPLIKKKIEEKVAEESALLSGTVANFASWVSDLEPFMKQFGASLDKILNDKLTLKLLLHLILKEVDAQVSI